MRDFAGTAQGSFYGFWLEINRHGEPSKTKFAIQYGTEFPSIRKQKFAIFRLFLLLSSFLIAGPCIAQDYLIPSDTFSSSRFLTLAAGGSILYGGTVVGLNEAWYKGFDRTPFHFFNDWQEWNNMDKMGHLYTAYFETELSYRGARWTGIKDPGAIWLAAGLGILFQSTIEFFDAHSARWGFSIYDMTYNLSGTALFTIQQLSWRDQRIRMKISSWPRKYSTAPLFSDNSPETSTLRSRATALFGDGYLERYLKDYNAQTVWVSVNLHSFTASTKVPRWFNLALGFGSENLFGGFTNNWTEGEANFSLSQDYKRYRQWYLSPDIDFRKIKTDSPVLKTLFNLINVFKIPAPAIEYNANGKWRWHWLHL
ncbi:MAG: DUF2279 domain-containing protein [Saprospiraceae bacterium]|nr:DUF2279 domain-containing protein [Saprospiraceae bacterium]